MNAAAGAPHFFRRARLCVRDLPCLTPQGRASRGDGGFPQRVKAHDVRSFHPGQVRDQSLELRNASRLDFGGEG